jgi:hypothetical protein
MLIEITPDGYLARSEDKPIVGRVYQLVPADDPTELQRPTFFALAQEFFASNADSYKIKSFKRFYDLIKRDLGAGFESFIYVDPKSPTEIHDVKRKEDIPAHIPYSLKRGKLKSLTDYTKKEWSEAIDRLCSAMDRAGVDTPKYREIRKGMEERQRLRDEMKASKQAR